MTSHLIMVDNSTVETATEDTFLQETEIYMTYKVADNIMMCVQIFDWLIDFGKIQKSQDCQCYLFVYIELSLLQWGTYLVLTMTVDKYIAIKWPHRAAIFSTPRKAILSICAIIISGAIYNLPHFFITRVIAGTCYGYSVKSILTKIYSCSTVALNAVIPFTLLIHMNYVIIKTVRNGRKMFRTHIGTLEIDARQKSMKSAENQLTTILHSF